MGRPTCERYIERIALPRSRNEEGASTSCHQKAECWVFDVPKVAMRFRSRAWYDYMARVQD